MDASEAESSRAVLHQAERVLSTRLGIAVDEAAMILRIRADSRGLPLHRVADEVIAQMVVVGDPNIAGSC